MTTKKETQSKTMSIYDVLDKFRTSSKSERDKGNMFERLMKNYLLTDPRYCHKLKKVWLWEEFPAKGEFGSRDLGIDLVARTDMGEYWAIQCKCYAEDTIIDKPAVDSFLATSGRNFIDKESGKEVRFAERIWISTTNNWGDNAEETLQNQDPKVTRIGLSDLEASSVDWKKLLGGNTRENARKEKKQPLEHQKVAVKKALEHYKENDRGKLIMACGTGKTYTSLLIAEEMLKGRGLVLFMVPSIALVGQALNAWASDAKKPIKAICICSDSKASLRTKKFDDTLESVTDLALPASTDPESVMKQLLEYQQHKGLVVVFSTYHSIESVAEAQRMILSKTKRQYGIFDLIICDEAHRTTGVKFADREDESNFTKIHSDEYVKGKKRLYMTATPRIYGPDAKLRATEANCILCSMNDEKIYGGGVPPCKLLVCCTKRAAN